MTQSRRNFIAKSSAALGLAFISGDLYSLSTKEKPIGIGIIGTGDRGSGLAGLLREINDVEVRAMSDIITFRLEQAKTFGSEKTSYYPDYRYLLEDKKVDAVIISTPFSMHAKMALEALDAGKHVYCEKTMTYGLEATRKVLNAARASNRIFQTGHQYHSSRLYYHIVELIKKGELGDISLIQCQWNRNGDWRRPVPDPKWERMINWRMYREYSGGLTAELCSHQIDFCNWTLGSNPLKVAGFGGIDYWKDGRETFDNVHLMMQYPNGVKATFTSLTTNAKDNYRIRILGKKGSIVIGKERAWLHAEQEIETEIGTVDGVSGATMNNWKGRNGVPIDVSHKNPTLQALLDFRESIITGHQPKSNVESGARASIAVQMALDAMYNESIEYWKEEYNF